MPRIPFGVTFDLVGLPAVTDRFRHLIAFMPRLAGQCLYTAAVHVLVKRIKEEIKNQNLVFRGELHQRTSARLTISEARDITVEVGSIGVPYGLNVEAGSHARKISVKELKNIMEWVRRKLGVDPMTYAGITIVHHVVTAIETHGNTPHPHIAPVWASSQKDFVDDAIARMRAKLKPLGWYL